MKQSTKSVFSLIDSAKMELEEFHVDSVFANLYEKNEFNTTNAYIADRAACENKNIYISTSNKGSTQQITLPIIYPAACRLLLDNATLYKPSLEIVQKQKLVFIADGVCSKYTLKAGTHSLVSKAKKGHRFRHYATEDDMFRKHFIADSKYFSDIKCHKTLSEYKAFWNALSSLQTLPPSMFAKKMVVVCQKSELYRQLRDLSMLHSLPMASINKKNFEITDETLPIEPMIIVVSDYELARDYMLTHSQKTVFEYLILAGDTKISKLKTLIKNDCANGIFQNFCLIGNNIISRDNSMLLWHWTKREEKHLNGKHTIEFIMDPVDGCENLIEAARELFSELNNICNEYGSIDNFSEIRQCFRRIMYDKLNISCDFDLEFGNNTKELIIKAMLSDNYDMEDFGDDLDVLMQKLRKVFDSKMNCPSIWDKLAKLSNTSVVLIVHNSVIQKWDDYLLSKGITNISLISFTRFKREIVSNFSKDNYYVGFLPSYSQIIWLESLTLERKTTLNILLYPPEISILKAQMKRIHKWEKGNSGKKDRSLFPNLNLQYHDREAADDIIGRFEGHFESSSTDQTLSYSENRECTSWFIEVTDDSGNHKLVGSPSKILRVENEGIELVPITDLDEGDLVLLYGNRNRESLYNILSEESDKFAMVNVFSRLWKRKLMDYIGYGKPEDDSRQGHGIYTSVDTVRLHRVSLNTGINQDYIFKQWILHTESVRFPMKSKLERVLKFLKDEDLLNAEEVENIRSARGFFVGVMISLGQNLSSEVQSIMLQQEDKLDEYITRSVVGNSNEYPLLSRFDKDAVASIVRHNYEKFTFIRIGEQSGGNDEE